jgi:hypothetical protein
MFDKESLGQMIARRNYGIDTPVDILGVCAFGWRRPLIKRDNMTEAQAGRWSRPQLAARG